MEQSTRNDRLQVFPTPGAGIVPESRESQPIPDGSGPVRNTQPAPEVAPESGERPTFCPWPSRISAGTGRPGWNVESSGCHVWTGYRDRGGYGRVRVDGRLQQVHRVRYEREVGPVPEGMVLDHLCRNHACCNPAHLEPVTQRENLHRGVGYASQTHCKAGHPLSGDNLVQAQLKLGFRRCRICTLAYDRNRRARRVEATHG